MSVAALPPSFRDLEVYRLIRVERKSTREAAAETGVSQTRVRQIVDRVAEFLLDAVPEGGEEMLAKRLQLAKVLAWERLDALHGEAVRRWRDSDELQTTIRETKTPDGPPAQFVTRKEMKGDTKYAFAAAKLSKLLADMPAYSLTSCLPEEADTPEEDCSPAATETIAAERPASPNVDASLPEEFTSVLEACREYRQENEFARPAQVSAKAPALSKRDRKRRAFLSNAG